MTSVPRVLLAPDKFKGSLTAPAVADALARGILAVAPAADLRRVPVADGGDGTVDAFVAAGWRRVRLTAPGPTGQPTDACYAVRGDTAVVELAAVVGLTKLPARQPDPLGASTFGLGVVIADAVAAGAREIVLGLGGSASSDGGAGMLQALGARILDAHGREVGRGGAALAAAARFDPAELPGRLAGVRFTLACDVDNPLLGANGAVRVYGPQKGAGIGDRAILEAALANWAQVVDPSGAGLPGAGAAGGTGFAAMTVLGARFRSGIEVILELLGLPALLPGAGLVITGEGSLDEQSLHGKAPIGVADAAGAAGVPVFAAVGRALLPADRLRAAGFTACYALTDLEPDPRRCVEQAAALLERLGARIAADHLR
ncbi:glycerate kinase family protein [Nocardia farcinica]|uniref:glycerate kinase family protein n=1 Tax=Nocardia farcinica TaxID=37329 RepID=UPI0018944814|nr:glycerate kinase [Nocardia farcinica]MBF6372101.1 glycerate kinase [Nocardia farcinica]